MSTQPAIIPNPHAKLTAKVPHIAMFSFSGMIYAASAVLGDLGNIFSQLMALAPAIGGFIHILYNEKAVAQHAYDANTSTPNSAVLMTAISALSTFAASGSTDVTALKAFVKAVQDAAKSS